METKGKYEVKQEIKKVEWFDDRWYKVGDEYYPSVTTILNVISKTFLARWRGDLGNEAADRRMFEAGERGTRIHSAFETLLKGGTVVYNPTGRPNYTKEEIDALTVKCGGFLEIMRYQDETLQIHKLAQFLEIVKPEILGSEVTVYSGSDRYAGTVDAILKIKGGVYPVNGRTPLKIPDGLYVADLKSGKVVDDNALLQTAAYAGAYEEMGQGKPFGTMVLHTGSSNRAGIEGLGVSIRTGIEMRNDYEDFGVAHKMWARNNKDKQPRNFEFPTMFTLKGELK